MNKREICISKLKAALKDAGEAHFISPLRVQVAAEILRQLEADNVQRGSITIESAITPQGIQTPLQQPRA